MPDPQKQTGQASLSDIVQNNGPSSSGSSGSASFNDIVQNPAPADDQPEKPGLFSRFAETVGIPRSVAEVKAMMPSLPDLAAAGGNPIQAFGQKMGRDYATNLGRQAKSSFNEAKEAQQNISEGGPKVANIKKQLAAGTDFALRGVLPPVGGNAVANVGQDSFDKNYPAMAGDALGAVTLALLGKGAEGPSAETSANRLAWSTGGEQPHILNTLNDVKSSAKLRGKPIESVGDYLDAIKSAKEDMNTQSGIAMQPIAEQSYIPVDVAQRIKSLIQPWMDVAPEGAVIKQKIMDAALPFESKEWTYRQMDGYRTKLQQDLSSYYKKGGVDRYQELKTDPQTAIDRQIVDGIQDIVYPKMDAALGSRKATSTH
jgi:hypothetical protein